jgi:hypothetical protein
VSAIKNKQRRNAGILPLRQAQGQNDKQEQATAKANTEILASPE